MLHSYPTKSAVYGVAEFLCPRLSLHIRSVTRTATNRHLSTTSSTSSAAQATSLKSPKQSQPNPRSRRAPPSRYAPRKPNLSLPADVIFNVPVNEGQPLDIQSHDPLGSSPSRSRQEEGSGPGGEFWSSDQTDVWNSALSNVYAGLSSSGAGGKGGKGSNPIDPFTLEGDGNWDLAWSQGWRVIARLLEIRHGDDGSAIERELRGLRDSEFVRLIKMVRRRLNERRASESVPAGPASTNDPLSEWEQISDFLVYAVQRSRRKNAFGSIGPALLTTEISGWAWDEVGRAARGDEQGHQRIREFFDRLKKWEESAWIRKAETHSHPGMGEQTSLDSAPTGEDMVASEEQRRAYRIVLPPNVMAALVVSHSFVPHTSDPHVPAEALRNSLIDLLSSTGRSSVYQLHNVTPQLGHVFGVPIPAQKEASEDLKSMLKPKEDLAYNRALVYLKAFEFARFWESGPSGIARRQMPEGNKAQFSLSLSEVGMHSRLRNWVYRNDAIRVSEAWNKFSTGIEEGWIDIRWAADSMNGKSLVEESEMDDDGVSERFELDREENDESDAEGPTALRESELPFLGPRLFASFLHSFVRLNLLSQASNLWTFLSNKNITPTLHIWTSLIGGYANIGDVRSAEESFSRLCAKESGVRPDALAWTTLIKAYFVAKDPQGGMKRVVDMLGSKELRSQYEGGKLPREAFNVVIHGLLQNLLEDAAMKIMDAMPKEGVQPDIVTINTFLRYYARTNPPDLVGLMSILKKIEPLGLKPDIKTFTTLLDGLLRGGKEGREAATRITGVMEQMGVKPNRIAYGALIANLAKGFGGRGNGSEEGEMSKETIEARSRCLEAAMRLLDEMESKGIKANEIIYTSLISGHLQAAAAIMNSSESAEFVGEGDGGGLHPFVITAEGLVQRMKARAINLNHVTYNMLISSYLDMATPYGTKMALDCFVQLRRKLLQRSLLGRSGRQSITISKPQENDRSALGSSSGTDIELLDSTFRGKGKLQDTYFILLGGLRRLGEFEKGRSVVKTMLMDGFEVRSSGLMRLVEDIEKGSFGRIRVERGGKGGRSSRKLGRR